MKYIIIKKDIDTETNEENVSTVAECLSKELALRFISTMKDNSHNSRHTSWYEIQEVLEDDDVLRIVNLYKSDKDDSSVEYAL